MAAHVLKIAMVMPTLRFQNIIISLPRLLYCQIVYSGPIEIDVFFFIGYVIRVSSTPRPKSNECDWNWAEWRKSGTATNRNVTPSIASTSSTAITSSNINRSSSNSSSNSSRRATERPAPKSTTVQPVTTCEVNQK